MIRQMRVAYRLSLLIIVAIGLPSFGQDIELPRTVPAYNQAYTEGANAWGNCSLGTANCPDLLRETGCLVTAFSSVLAYYEITVSVSATYSCTGEARTGMDPGILNDWLREVDGYGQCSQDPVGNCCLIWGRLPADLEISTHVNRSDVGLNPVAAVVIEHALRQGQLVVAGVHWGASCNGGSSQSEDCHWVILTGKQDGVYTIVDPFNPDSTSPYGIRTTLDAGVKGAYIIDRFVVVEPRAGGEIDVAVGPNPAQMSYQVGDRIQLTLTTPGTSAALVPYARITRPSGQVAYVTLEGTSASAPRYEASRQGLLADPRPLNSAWTWFNRTATEADIGRWIWEVWVERPDDPGIKLGRQTISYTVKRSSTSIGSALIGVVLVIAIAAVAFLTTIGEGLE